MLSPGFPGLPRPTGERAPAAQGKARARSVAASLTPEGQGLRVPGCSTPPRSSRDFLGAPSRDYSILRLPQPLRPSSRRGPRSVWPSAFGFFSRAVPVRGAGPRLGAGAGLEAGSPALSERDPRARRTWGGPRLQLSTGGGKANRWPSARWLPPFPEGSEGHGRAAWA